ncbi:MAG: LysR family transcriptional regulator [Blastocatellia bacterium]
MHIETLKTFCDLVETGSFSKAAALNFVSQSAVSQQIKGLESRFNCTLIERSSRKQVVLTAVGREFYGECKDIVDRLRALETRLQQPLADISGTVRVATVYSVGLHEIPRYIKEFIKAHPQVNIRLEYSRTDKVYEALLNNTIDFGVVALPQRRAQIEIIPLREEKLVIVCSPEHPLAARQRVSIAKLAGEAFVGFERDIPTRKAIDRCLKQHRVKVNYVMELDNIETIKRSVEVGIGVSILPENAVANEVRNSMLHALKISEGTFKRSLGVIHRRGKAFSKAAQEFLHLLTTAR